MRRSETPPKVGDRHWRGSARLAVSGGLVFCVMTLMVDWNAGSLTPVRIMLWLPLSAVVFVILLPPRVSAGPGRLVVRTPWRRTTVHTNALSAVRYYDAVSSHLILQDTLGNRLQIDTRTLAANPLTLASPSPGLT